MKNLLLTCLALFALSLSAQTTHVISWQIGANGEPASPTVEVGDTVLWEWDDGAPHTVTSQDGSTETFDSGQLTGDDQTYSFTFTQEGSNDYRCEVHPSSMFGTITVQTVLGIEENTPEGFKMISYITTDRLKLILPAEVSSGKISMYDLNGKELLLREYRNQEQLDFSLAALNDGVYIIKIANENLEFAKRFIKQ